MRRGTTPTHVFETSVDLTTADVLFLTYKQGKSDVLEKTLDDVEVTEDRLTVKLSQEETLKFDKEKGVRIQCRAKFPDGTAIASEIINVQVCEILKEGEI